MRYYHVKYTDNISSGFGGMAQGPFISIRKKYKLDTGLLEHEKTHVRQWWKGIGIMLMLAAVAGICGLHEVAAVLTGLAPGAHPLAYRILRPYRRWAEVQAYRVQLGVGRYASHQFAVEALVSKYDLRLTADQAKKLLRI